MKKAIIVDDSESIRDNIKNELETKGDFQVFAAEDGILGLELIRNNQDCSIIITDLNMPNMSGFEMLEALKKENLCNKVPKIILTTEDFLADNYQDKLSDKGKELGIEAWVPKAAKSDAFIIIHGVIKRVLKKRESS